jgi:hypothetical protein
MAGRGAYLLITVVPDGVLLSNKSNAYPLIFREHRQAERDIPQGSLLTRRWRKPDSNLYGAFPVKEFVFGFCWFFVRSGKGPFFIPSPTIRFAERAEWGQGTETLAKLGGLPPSGACVSQRLDA